MPGLTRPEAVTLALYALGGADQAVDTEDVAVRVADIAPGMFAWRQYPDRLDKELVRVALSDARLKKQWVVGSHEKGGWTLTLTGQRFGRANEDKLAGAPQVRRRGRDEQKHAQERLRLISSVAFERFNGGRLEEVAEDEADAFFRINVYVEGQARERKIARLENLFGSDPELGPAVTALAARARVRK